MSKAGVLGAPYHLKYYFAPHGPENRIYSLTIRQSIGTIGFQDLSDNRMVFYLILGNSLLDIGYSVPFCRLHSNF